jgi:hypothetical protein
LKLIDTARAIGAVAGAEHPTDWRQRLRMQLSIRNQVQGYQLQRMAAHFDTVVAANHSAKECCIRALESTATLEQDNEGLKGMLQTMQKEGATGEEVMSLRAKVHDLQDKVISSYEHKAHAAELELKQLQTQQLHMQTQQELEQLRQEKLQQAELHNAKCAQMEDLALQLAACEHELQRMRKRNEELRV